MHSAQARRHYGLTRETCDSEGTPIAPVLGRSVRASKTQLSPLVGEDPLRILYRQELVHRFQNLVPVVTRHRNSPLQVYLERRHITGINQVSSVSTYYD